VRQGQIIPFEGDEFVRDDIPYEKILEMQGKSVVKEKKDLQDKIDKSKGQMKLGGNGKSQNNANGKTLEERLMEAYERDLNRPREDGWIENPNRPTGYGIPDENDNEEEMRRKLAEDIENGVYVPPNADKDDFKRWLQDTYVGSPYDSRKKKQARSVIRNITGISVGIGIIFTAIWFAFPGKFINVRGTDPAAYYAERYDAGLYNAPQALMEDTFKQDNGPVLEKVETRFGEEKVNKNQGGLMNFAPAPRVDL
jgi:hypothetical protein